MKMKKIKYIFAMLALVMAVGSCDKYLQEAAAPLDRPGGDDFYDTPEKVKSGVLGLLNQLYSIYDRVQQPQVYLNVSDDGQFNENEDALGNFSLTRTGAPQDIWARNFTLVSRANIMIASIERGFPDYDSDPLIARFMGDARAMRAWAYMNLVVGFGDLPKMTEQLTDFEEAVSISRSPASEIWDEIIIPDLEYARDHCYTRSQIEELNEIGMFTKGAARLYLAEAYLFSGMNSQAEAEAEAVISSGEYTWVDSFEDLFGGTDNHSASIFEIQFKYPDQINQYIRFLPFSLQQAAGFNLPQTITRPTQHLVDTMLATGEDAVRYFATCDTGMFDVIDSVYVRTNYWRKYHDETQKGTDITNGWNVNLLRLADAYHLAAEAEVQQGKIADAFTHLNMTRGRAQVTLYDPAGVTQDEALGMYLHERRMEFAGEFKRWRDLRRTGTALEHIGAHLGREIESFRLIWPIPESEIALNPDGMIQNPGY